MDILHFAIYSSINRSLSFFHVLAIIMNVDVQISLQYPAFSYFGDIPRSGISVTCGNSTFNFLRKLYTVIHSVCTISHSHQFCTRFPISLHPCQHLLFPGFVCFSFIVTIPMDVQWYLNVVLICMSLPFSDDVYLFICLLAILYLGKMSIQVFCLFFF